ncbi:hypothetical protein D3C73_983770 [compost metagenome]
MKELGYEPYLCETEEEARALMSTLPQDKKWPCLFTASDTTGEKDFEEFFTSNEVLDIAKFENLGIIKNELHFDNDKLNNFATTISSYKAEKKWSKDQIINLFHQMIPDFGHKETGKYLDAKM